MRNTQSLTWLRDGVRASAVQLAHWTIGCVALLAPVIATAGATEHTPLPGGGTVAPVAGPSAAPPFVGSAACAECHPAQAALWRTSQHHLAMDTATDQTVLGDFNSAHFEYYGVKSRFFRQGDKFMVESDGPDGALATFEIKYTFGVTPLQQYLVAFPDGRLQALSIAWDSRPGPKGQRWFHLYPEQEIRHDDVLHWTRLNQNWNFMCAECHSTGVSKSYDPATDRYATTWAEISVGCEACHGRGAHHVAEARSGRDGVKTAMAAGLAVAFDERRDVVWSMDTHTGQPRRSTAPALVRKEVETCGLCHARRAAIAEDWVPGQSLLNTHQVAPMTPSLYFADGQMRDEVYNYGSFRLGRMFAAGATCSDCHDPHSGKLRFPGDATCLQCHQADPYAGAAHHQHPGANPALTCASCHMPTRMYMVNDPRHDHSFRVPRPDLSARIGSPDACTDCHTDRPAAWAAAAIERWFGPMRSRGPRFAEAFDAAWNHRPGADALLAAVAADRDQPAEARAGALAARAKLAPAPVEAAGEGLADPDPMVRIGALDLMDPEPPGRLWPIVAPLLSDPVRSVRLRAASILAGVPRAIQPPADRARFERAAGEFVAAQLFNADRPEARSALGRFHARRGDYAAAEANYQAALRLAPSHAPAAVNLADLYRALNRDRDGESVLRAALIATPSDAGLHHALGLTLVRLGLRDEALEHLRDATALMPERARYGFVYALALHSAGRSDEATAVLTDCLTRHPDDRDAAALLAELRRRPR